MVIGLQAGLVDVGVAVADPVVVVLVLVFDVLVVVGVVSVAVGDSAVVVLVGVRLVVGVLDVTHRVSHLLGPALVTLDPAARGRFPAIWAGSVPAPETIPAQMPE